MHSCYLLNLIVPALILPAIPAFASGSADDRLTVDPKAKMICKRSQETGSRFYKQTCKTAAQWDALTEQHKRDLREVVDRPQIEIRR